MNRCAGRTGVLSALCLWLFSGYSLFCTAPAPLSSFRRSLCNCTLRKRGLFVEFRVKCIEITAVKLFLHEPEAFAESLVVDDLPLPQEDASMNAALLSSVFAGGNFGHYRHGRHKRAGRKLRTALMFLRNTRLTFRLAPSETLSVFFNLLSGQ